MAKIIITSKLNASKTVEIPHFETPKLISRKIRVIDEVLDFHTVQQKYNYDFMLFDEKRSQWMKSEDF